MARGCRELTPVWDLSLRRVGRPPSDPARTTRATALAIPDLGNDLAATLDWARSVGDSIDGDDTTTRWEVLATAAEVDVAAARVLEPHLDALAILDEAEASGTDVSVDERAAPWGVFAAEGSDTRLVATRERDRWSLSGVKPWCSLARDLTHALVTAWVSESERALFAVDLHQPGVTPHDGPWISRGLAAIVSAPVSFERAAAVIVGEPGWYTSRPGFAWGGVGVAAVWWGAATPLLGSLEEAARRGSSDQLATVYLGGADVAWWSAKTVLLDAAARADARDSPGVDAARARGVVVGAVECILTLVDRALGPAPLTTDERHARRVNDLRVYVRQDHAERDLARLGRKPLA